MKHIDSKATRLLEAARRVLGDADRVGHAMREGDTLEEALAGLADGTPEHLRRVRAEVLRRLGVRVIG